MVGTRRLTHMPGISVPNTAAEREQQPPARPHHATALLEWEAYSAAPVDGGRRVLAREGAARAARALAVKLLAAVERDRALSTVCKDAGRYVAAMSALYLHFAGALTLPTLKETCIASGFLGPGRARAVLRFLEELAYLEPAPVSAVTSGARRYVPTAPFIALWRDHLRAALDAACMIEPAASLVSDALDDPGIAETFIRLHAEGSLRSVSDGAPSPVPALVRVVMHHYAGNHLIWHLLSAGDDDEFPTRAATRASIAGLARRFEVSRVHVRRLLEGATREGVIQIDTDGAVRFADAARGDIRFLYAAQLAQLLASAAATLRIMRGRISSRSAALNSVVPADSQNCPVAASVAGR